MLKVVMSVVIIVVVIIIVHVVVVHVINQSINQSHCRRNAPQQERAVTAWSTANGFAGWSRNKTRFHQCRRTSVESCEYVRLFVWLLWFALVCCVRAQHEHTQEDDVRVRDRDNQQPLSSFTV